MSTDIASLGIKIDTTQATSATKALNDLTRAAKPAADAVGTLERASVSSASGLKSGSDEMRRYESVARRTGETVQQVRDRFSSLQDGGKKASDALKNLTQHTGLARHEMINLSRQVQDVGTMFAMGASPMQVFSSQAAQVYDIFASSKGNLRGFGSQVAAMITPMRAFGLGVGALGVATYAAYSSWKTFAKQLDDTARIAGTTTLEMSKLQGAASFKGIKADDFSEGMARFSRQVYLAKNGMGELAQVFRANGVSAKDFNGAIERAADLIKNAGSDQERLVLLQQMGLPATMEWVRLLQGGAQGLRAAKAEMSGVAKEQDELLRKQREMDKSWDSFWTKAGEKARNAFVIAASGVGQFFSDLNAGFGVSGGQKPPTRIRVEADTSNFGNGGKPTIDKDAELARIARAQQYLGLVGQTMTAEEARRQVTLTLNAAALNGVAVDERRAETLKRLASENLLGITQIKASTDAWNVETATVAMATGKATEYAAVQNALNEARRSGRTLTSENVAAIEREAAALGNAAQRAEDMRWGYESLVRGPLQTFRTSLAESGNFFDALKKAGLNALDAISSKLMDMAAQKLWQSALGSFGGGGSGLFSFLGGGTAAPTMGLSGLPALHHSGYGPGDQITARRSVPPTLFRNAPRFHSGIGPGERAAIIRNDESVLTPGQMRQLSPAGASSVLAPIAVSLTMSGGDASTGAALVAQLRAELPAIVVQNVKRAQEENKLR